MLVSVDFERLQDPGVAFTLSLLLPRQGRSGSQLQIMGPSQNSGLVPPFHNHSHVCCPELLDFASFFPSCFQDSHILFRNPSCGFLYCDLSLSLFPLLRMSDIFCVA